MLGFPFGQPITPVSQTDRRPKRVFVLGVYASAVHARWVGDDGKTIISALAVASEPEIFWRGEDAQAAVSRIPVPAGAGRLVPAGQSLNGPSGIALDSRFLAPLGTSRSDTWFCDLLPESRCNPSQRAAIAREYDRRMESQMLPSYDFPAVPSVLASEARRIEIEEEIRAAGPEVLITLGDQPLKWFTRHYGAHSRLGAFGQTPDTYGRLHDISVGGTRMKLLPLVHPRQAGRLGSHSASWSELHDAWVTAVAPTLLAPA